MGSSYVHFWPTYSCDAYFGLVPIKQNKYQNIRCGDSNLNSNNFVCLINKYLLKLQCIPKLMAFFCKISYIFANTYYSITGPIAHFVKVLGKTK